LIFEVEAAVVGHVLDFLIVLSEVYVILFFEVAVLGLCFEGELIE